MTGRFFIALGSLLALLIPGAGRAAQPHPLAADLIIHNANVRTLDDGAPRAEAVAVRGEQIAAVGSNQEIARLRGPATRMIDAGGRLVLPGFNDSHAHMILGGQQLASVDLRDADSPEEFAARIRDFAAKLPPGRWITGISWDHERWPGAPLPRREWIDEFTRENPVALQRLDGHMLIANSLALQIAGITKDTPDPDGGVIVRDEATGEPTGVLKDAAADIITRNFVPPPSLEERMEAIRAASEEAARNGVTSVQDMSGMGNIEAYQLLHARGELKTRAYLVWRIYRMEDLEPVGMRAMFGDDWLRMGGYKAFVDGSLGSSTALFHEPYSDEPDTHGIYDGEMIPREKMLERVQRADAAGMQVMVHAIGDRGVDDLLDIYEEVATANGERDRRFRCEHAQHLSEPAFKRFAEQKIIASMQPYHAIDDGRWCDKRIGPDRSRRTYAFRTLIDNDVELAFGSDWPVAPLSVMDGIYAAVTRRTLDGAHPTGWVPEEKISVEQAVRAYTIGSAYAEFMEHRKGLIKPGMLADLVVLSDDIFEIDPVEIANTKVDLTIVGGRIVFERTEAE